jgi:hypothetical protein
MSPARSLATATVIVLTALPLTGCGGGAPDDAATDDFCEVWNTERAGSGDDSPEDQVDAAHESADRLEEVGTPDGIEDDARSGFEVFVDYLGDVDADDMDEMNQAADEDSLADGMGISEDDAADVMAFFEYAAVTCSGTEEEPTE